MTRKKPRRQLVDMPNFNKLATIFLLITLSACSVAGSPELDRAQIPSAPENWTARPEIIDASAVLQDGWVRQFGNADLDDAIKLAFAHNRNLQSVLAQLRAARAAQRIARADLFPRVDVNVGVTESDGMATAFDGGLAASWEADIWGRNLALARSGKADARAAAADYAAARQALAAAVTRSWYDLGAARLTLDLASSDLDRRKDTLRITDARFRAGLASGLDVRLAQVAVSNSEDRLEAATRTRRNSSRALEVLTGAYPSAVQIGATELTAPPGLGAVSAPVSVLAGRPDLVAAEARLDAAGFRAVEARQALLPRLTINFDSTAQSTSLGDIFDPGTYINAISAGLLQPLFRGGALKAETDRQGELARSALFDYAQLALTAFQEVEDRLDAETTLARQVTATALAAKEATVAVRLTRRRYVNGRSTIFDLINAQTTAIAAETRAVEARRARLENRINLHLAMGSEPFPAARPIS